MNTVFLVCFCCEGKVYLRRESSGLDRQPTCRVACLLPWRVTDDSDTRRHGHTRVSIGKIVVKAMLDTANVDLRSYVIVRSRTLRRRRSVRGVEYDEIEIPIVNPHARQGYRLIIVVYDEHLLLSLLLHHTFHRLREPGTIPPFRVPPPSVPLLSHGLPDKPLIRHPPLFQRINCFEITYCETVTFCYRRAHKVPGHWDFS